MQLNFVFMHNTHSLINFSDLAPSWRKFMNNPGYIIPEHTPI